MSDATKAKQIAEDAAAAALLAKRGSPTAPLSDRCAAVFIDCMISLILLLPLSVAAEALRGVTGPVPAYLGLTAVWMVWLVAATAWIEVVWRGTIGKRLCGLAVVDQSGSGMTFRRALVRNACKVGVPLPFIALHYALRGRRDGRALHDRTANSKVVFRGAMTMLSPSSQTANDEELAISEDGGRQITEGDVSTTRKGL